MADEKPGKALEGLVASLEKALAENPNIVVHSPMRLTDRATEKLREHDVVLELKERHHAVLIGIECRDRSRPIGVPQIEGFWAKCQDTGINQGIMVSSTGFYNTARTKADHLGVRCLDIEEVESFDWLVAPGIEATTTHLLSNDWTFYPTEDGVVEKDNVEVTDLSGNILTMAVLTANAQKQLSALLPDLPLPVEMDEITVKFPGDGLLLRNTVTGETVPVNFAHAKIRYSVKQEHVPFRLVHYQEKSSDDTITNAAYADLQFGDNEARVMIVYKENEGGKVMLIPKGKKNA